MTKKELDHILKDLRDDPWLKIIGIFAVLLMLSVVGIVGIRIHISLQYQQQSVSSSLRTTFPI